MPNFKQDMLDEALTNLKMKLLKKLGQCKKCLILETFLKKRENLR